MTRPLLLLASLSLAAGCLPPSAPRRADPFAGLGLEAAPAAFPELTVSVIVSENTRKSVDFGASGSRFAGFDADALVDKTVEVLKRNFKATRRAADFSEAAAQKSDVIAVLDVFVTAKSSFRFEVSSPFFSPDRRDLGAPKGAAENRMTMTGAGAVVTRTTEQALQAWEAELRAVPQLVLLAKAAASRGGAAAAASPKRTPASDVDRAGYKQPEDPAAFALVIGVEGYANLPPAVFAEHDAEAVREHMRALGVPERNILYLTGAQAGRAGIEKYVESWLPRNVQPGSRVYFYFSGHGAPDPATGQAFLVPWDGDPKFLENTGYPLRRLFQKLDALKARQVVVALDACFSGAGGRSVLPAGARPLVAKVETAPEGPSKLTVFSAAGGDEITGTDDAQGHGLFTYHFLKGLAGGAADASGRVTAQRLQAYLLPKVQDGARRQNRDQTPRLDAADPAVALR